MISKLEDISLLDESNSGHGNNSPYYLLKAIKLLSHHREFNSATSVGELPGLLSGVGFDSGSLRAVGRILGSDSLRRTTFHVIDAGAVTLLILRGSLGLSLGTAARQLCDLQSYGIITPSVRLHRPMDAEGGPRVKLFQTPDASPEQVNQAVELQRRLESPKYLQAVLVSQTLLEDYPLVAARGETSYADIVTTIRRMKIGYSVPDIAQLASRYLHERGIKVWR